MSYIRCGYPLHYVDGKSADYIYCDGEKIVDYHEAFGNVADETLVELVARGLEGCYAWDDGFKDYLKKQLANRLEVKLRKKPLDDYYEVFKKHKIGEPK